jgi:hypothetical protein
LQVGHRCHKSMAGFRAEVVSVEHEEEFSATLGPDGAGRQSRRRLGDSPPVSALTDRNSSVTATYLREPGWQSCRSNSLARENGSPSDLPMTWSGGSRLLPTPHDERPRVANGHVIRNLQVPRPRPDMAHRPRPGESGSGTAVGRMTASGICFPAHHLRKDQRGRRGEGAGGGVSADLRPGRSGAGTCSGPSPSSPAAGCGTRFSTSRTAK